jgi:hypothetical protein
MKGNQQYTRDCSADQFDPRLRRVFQEYFRSHQLGELSAENLVCCETRTERSARGKFAAWLEGNPDTTDYLGLVLTDRSLIWVRVGDQSAAIVTGANLNEIRVRSYASRLSKESGLEIAGLIGDRKAHVKGKLALGPEPAAKKFIDEVIGAVEKANPPPKRREIPWLKWIR